MQHLVDSVRQSLASNNHYAALFQAIALPDIAAKLDGRTGGSKARYVAWFNEYLLHKYQSHIGQNETLHVFLSGNDCYALRCAMLHEGEFDITSQRARNVLESFQFVVPKGGNYMHNNQYQCALQLQVDVFAEDICSAVEDWMQTRAADPDVSRRIAEMPRIYFD